LWPDAAYEEWHISIQYDGAGHGGSAQYLRDIRRETVTRECGWLEVRVSKDDLAGGRPAVVRKVRAALEGRGWRAR
jgi:very-short-patch-repair endonuclease